jgi:hypothetical protein
MNLHKMMGIMVISMLNNGEIMNLKGVGWNLVLDLQNQTQSKFI